MGYVSLPREVGVVITHQLDEVMTSAMGDDEYGARNAEGRRIQVRIDSRRCVFLGANRVVGTSSSFSFGSLVQHRCPGSLTKAFTSLGVKFIVVNYQSLCFL